jgi:hypothetical protein
MVLVPVALVCTVAISACGSIGAAATARKPGNGASASQVVRNFEVLLVPNLQASTAGWCLTAVVKGKGGCDVPQTWNGPVFAENCVISPPADIEAYALTTSDVSAVSVDGGPHIPTRAEPSLMEGLRAVFVELHGPVASQTNKGSCPSFTPLDGQGRPIMHEIKPGPPLQVTLPGRREWQHPAHPQRGTCVLGVENLRGYVARWGNVATQIKASRGLIDHAVLSCVDAEYFSPEEASMDTAVLLDAAHPGSEPALLPGMRSLPGHHGIFEAPGSEGLLVGRRIPGAWLVVEEGGTGLQEPLLLLEHLHATVDLKNV